MSPSRSGVLAVRHAPTVADGLCVGNAEVPCTMSAEEAATRIREQSTGYRVVTVWSSLRSRCLEPARVLAATMGLSHRVDDRLREIDLGEWQGRPWAAIESSDPGRYQAWLSNWIRTRPPGGETALELQQRVCSWWLALPNGCHLLVAHAGVMRALRVAVQGMTWAQAMREPVPYLRAQWFALSPVEDRRP